MIQGFDVTLFSLISRHDMGSIRVAWELRNEIKIHRLFFEDGLDPYEEISIMKSFERIYEDKEVDFYTGFDDYTDENRAGLAAIIEEIVKYQNKYQNVVLNVSEASGTSCAFFGEKLLPLGVKFVSYNPSEHEMTIIDNKTHQTVQIERDLTIEKLFGIRGFDVEVGRNREWLREHKASLETIFKKPKKFIATRQKLLNGDCLKSDCELFRALKAVEVIDQKGH